ncbi:hypothetical protein PE067_15845 [Paracoccus sp. DMF-8]|nr:hypothetical protein [Paracoccus sp. DMF-8]MDF3607480.1 hypothetical protein [Paracoccus sp. DMF-8]
MIMPLRRILLVVALVAAGCTARPGPEVLIPDAAPLPAGRAASGFWR